MKITICRTKLERRTGKLAWVWLYGYQIDNDPPITYDTHLAALKNYLKSKYPKASISYAW